MNGLTMPSFRPSRVMITAARPTSEPVPDVVGTATSGQIWPWILLAPPSTAAYWPSGPA